MKKTLLSLLGGVLLSFAVWAEGININTAGAEELQSLDGVGAALAERIIAERENGAFSSLEEVADRVSGLGTTFVANNQGAVAFGPSKKGAAKGE